MMRTGVGHIMYRQKGRSDRVLPLYYPAFAPFNQMFFDLINCNMHPMLDPGLLACLVPPSPSTVLTTRTAENTRLITRRLPCTGRACPNYGHPGTVQ